MPIEMALWRMDGGQPRSLAFSPLDSEARLEKLLAGDVSLLGLDIMVVGQQVITDFGGRIDLIAIDAAADLHVIELKRDRTPRDIVAQTLDYASWVSGLGHQQVTDLYAQHVPGRRLEAAFEERFGGPLPEIVNTAHHLMIVASALDPSTERIVDYLVTQYDMPLTAIFFRYLLDGDREYLARTWLYEPAAIDPVRPARTTKAKSEPWNGQDFFVSIGEDSGRRAWADCVRYGYVSAGGAPWYSRTMYALKPGHRVFARIPQVGYVGVGVVVDSAVPIGQFEVEVEGETRPLLDVPLVASNPAEFAVEDERVEVCVRIEWIKTLAKDQAIKDKGLYANQNSATALRSRFTLEVLTDRFGLDG